MSVAAGDMAPGHEGRAVGPVRRVAGPRVADGAVWANNRHLPGAEVWLVGEWRSTGERKFYLANLPPRTSLRALAAAIKARWVCEQAHQRLKGELGLGQFKGRSWTGLHRHGLMSCIAYAFLQHLRLARQRRTGRGVEMLPTRCRQPGPPPNRTCPRSAAPSSAGCSRRSCTASDFCTATNGSNYRLI